jgi:hypothetical protein
MSRRLSVTECPNCGAPVGADDAAEPVPECNFCHTALPYVDDAPPPRPVPHPLPPYPPGRRSHVGRTIAIVTSAVVLVVVLLVVIAALHGNATGSAPALASGARIEVGYDIRLTGSGHPGFAFQVPSGHVQFKGACVNGGKSVQFQVDLPAATITVPAGDTSWLPTADATSAAGFQGVSTVPAVCGSGGVRVDSDSISLTTTTPNAEAGQAIAVRWHWKSGGQSGGPWEGPFDDTL